MSRRAWFLFAAMCVIWGIPYLLIKVSVGQLSPATLVFFRTSVGAILLIPVAMSRGSLRPLLTRWRWLIAYTIAEIGMPWLLLSDAERHISSSLAGLLIAAVPFAGVILGLATGSEERFDSRRLLGLVLGFGGVAVLVGLDVTGSSLLAVGEVGLVVIGYATGPLIISRRLQDVPGLGVVAASLGLAALAYAPYGLTHIPGSLSDEVIGSVLVLGLVCTAIAFLLFFALIAEAGPVRATVITYVNPAVALVLGVALLKERFTLGTAAGFALVLLGSYLATRRATRRTSPAPVTSPT
jgi:drug/metabolite transporter (DMT)-like permease